MKNVINNIKKQVELNGKNLYCTGQELMEMLKIKEEDLISICEKFKTEMYDYIQIECSTKYIWALKEQFEFPDEVFWFMKNEKDPKYITVSLDKIYTSCDELYGIIFKQGNFKHYSCSLKKYIDELIKISEDDEIKLYVTYLYDCKYIITIKNKEKVKVEFDWIDINKEIDGNNDLYQKAFLYQLIVLSYDVPMKETLEILCLI